MKTIHIRSAVHGDVAALPEVERAAAAKFPAGFLPKQIPCSTVSDAQFHAGVDDSTLWVAEAPGTKVVGFLLARTEEWCLHVVEMDVLPAASGQGVGTALISKACTAAAAMGLVHVTLTTFAHIPWNAPFYLRRGFSVVTDLGAFPHLAVALAQEAEVGFVQRIALARNVA